VKRRERFFNAKVAEEEKKDRKEEETLATDPPSLRSYGGQAHADLSAAVRCGERRRIAARLKIFNPTRMSRRSKATGRWPDYSLKKQGGTVSSGIRRILLHYNGISPERRFLFQVSPAPGACAG